jgi:RNA-directed DNA polymerase
MNNTIKRLDPLKSTKESIASIENLCAALNISNEDLQYVLNIREDEMYVQVNIPKADGGVRKVHKPHHAIRKIQRRINKRIFKQIVLWPSYIYGSVPNECDSHGKVIENKDYINCASKHCGAKSLLKVDIKDFFDHIHSYHVKEMFLNFFKYDEDVAQVLTSITCFKEKVVQGALTSSYIANLCLWDLEGHVVQRLSRKNLVYTRLVDDISISSKVSNFDFDNALSVVLEMLLKKDLPLNKEKTKSSYTSMEPLSVHGLRINFKTPRLPSNELKILRSAVKNIERLALEPGYRVTHAYRKDHNRCVGRVNKLKRLGHEKHASLIKKLLAIKPLPSKVDIKRCSKLVDKLERDHPTMRQQFWYYRRYNKAQERLNILQRTYKKASLLLRNRLRVIKPDYD